VEASSEEEGRVSAQRVNVRPGSTLEIVAHCGFWPRWQAACSAARELGALLKCAIIVRDADAEGRGWKDGRPR
jgi:hypothetical protein